MGLYKRGRTWFIDYYYPPGRDGKRVREKVGPNREEARIVLGERLKDIRQGRNPELRQITPRGFAEVVKEFEERYIPQRRNPESYKVKVRILDKAFEGMTLQEITTKVVEDFIAARNGGRQGHSEPMPRRAGEDLLMGDQPRVLRRGESRPAGEAVRRVTRPSAVPQCQ